MTTFLIILLIHTVIGVLIGLFMFNGSGLGKAPMGWQKVAAVSMYLGKGQLWLLFIIYVLVGA